MIYEALNDTNNNCKKVKSRGSKFFTLSPKKPLKKKKYILQRKQNSDNIRKKIKTRFLKSLKKQINQKLKKAGSKYIFANLQQSFICNLSKEKNKKVLDLTLEEIFSKNFCEEKEIKVDKEKYEHNLKVLKYLEDNKEISEKSNFNNIKNMKFSQIFSEYLESKEFGKEISTLKQEKENDKYIKDYIIKARNFLYFFNH
jgi:ribonuclease BN (tRNA processing enzyme)